MSYSKEQHTRCHYTSLIIVLEYLLFDSLIIQKKRSHVDYFFVKKDNILKFHLISFHLTFKVR